MATGSTVMQRPLDAGPMPNGDRWYRDEMNGPERSVRDMRPIFGALAVISLLIVATGILFFAMAGRPGAALTQPAKASLAAKPLRPVHLADVPAPDPLVFAPIGADRARILNASMPFADSVGRAAKPFTSIRNTESRERAIDCLASAMWYEAGDDARGQRAVGQVVLNRVRHPAFPSNVCGVVFQGSDRATGCQFTFTCDGALQRKPSDAAFADARSQARAMLEGKVDPEVGLATHYHTDWVHPVWSAAMEKLTKVDTHLFFRWRGKWGGASIMTQDYGEQEPAIAKLAAISPIHRSSLPPELIAMAPKPAPMAEGVAGIAPQPALLALAPPPPKRDGSFDLSVAPDSSAGTPALAALDMCDDKSFCKVVGRLPGSANPAFLYVRDRRTGVERTYWDCTAFPRQDTSQCLSSGNRWLSFDGNLQSGDA